MKLAVLFHRLGPYHHARLLSAVDAGLVVTAIEFSAETREYAWSRVDATSTYRRVTLFENCDSRSADPNELQRRVGEALDHCGPQVVAIPGWSDRGAFAALSWCLGNDVPAIVMSESTAHDERRRLAKEWVKRRIVGCYSTGLVGGRLHAAYLQELGMDSTRVFTGYDVVDNQHFRAGAEEVQCNATVVRQKLGLPQNYFLASARFIEKKHLPGLLHAYAAYVARAGEAAWDLVILGDGPLQPSLESEVATLRLASRVHMPGFKQYDELPAYYGLAQAFVHASTTEQWGLVVNEAIASGLPVLVSNRCGCVPELVHDGVNGFTFDPHNVQEIATTLIKFTELPLKERERYRSASFEIAAQNEPVRFGEGLRRAAEMALALPRRRGNALDNFLMGRLMKR